jgi:outer membrane protein assembly factor BamE (lipoprotein component of BamABCDE complex)
MMACSYQDGPFAQVEGRFFDYRHVGEIANGQTTEQQIRRWFGTPLETEQDPDGTTRLRYYSKRKRENVERILLLGRRHSQVSEQQLVVTAKDGIVVTHAYSSN